MIFVTPDGERSMNTYLGACVELGPEDVEPRTSSPIRASPISKAISGIRRAPRRPSSNAARIAHENGREMSMTLSDSFCVDRYRGEFLDLMRSGTVDIVFANRAETLALYETSDFDDCADLIAADCKLAAVTMSEAWLDHPAPAASAFPCEPLKVDNVVDTTGAGDLYAAGFLFGYTNGFELADCGRLGSLAAGLVIQQIGPRMQVPLKQAALEQIGIIL